MTEAWLTEQISAIAHRRKPGQSQILVMCTSGLFFFVVCGKREALDSLTNDHTEISHTLELANTSLCVSLPVCLSACLLVCLSVWSGLVRSGQVWSGQVWSGLVWSGLVWSGLVWSGLVLSCLVLSCLVLSCLVLSCLVLSCLCVRKCLIQRLCACV